MKVVTLIVCSTLVSTVFCLPQKGIYSIVDPESRSINTCREVSLEKVIGDTIKDIVITEYTGGWKDKKEAKKELIQLFNRKGVTASSGPLWNMDFPVELSGMIVFKDGTRGTFAVAQHRVGFQDNEGTPWFFEWEERVPWEE
ncbi:MAG: hypothetical protein CR997_13285 [Acidobacteria bacterium]|nr:MAG: hypothetical protein CR997_13285 [Acidobacteriota bacterium]